MYVTASILGQSRRAAKADFYSRFAVFVLTQQQRSPNQGNFVATVLISGRKKWEL
jgi:hypothetical protein